MLLVEGYCETVLFRYLSNGLYASLSLRKYISYEGQVFLKNVQNLIYISKLHKKIEKKILISKIISSEFVP